MAEVQRGAISKADLKTIQEGRNEYSGSEPAAPMLNQSDI